MARTTEVHKGRHPLSQLYLSWSKTPRYLRNLPRKPQGSDTVVSLGCTGCSSMGHETRKSPLQWRRSIGRLVGFALLPGVAWAQDLPPPQTTEAPAPPGSPLVQQFAFDGSVVATSLGGRSLDLNVTFAPFDVNNTGFRVRLSGNASSYRFPTGDNPSTTASGHSLEGGVLAGYQWSLPRVSFIGLVGPALVESNDNGVQREQWGVKTVLSAYALPSDQTMAFGSISYSTVSNFLQLQAKAGTRLVGNFYVGPEGIFSWRDVIPGINNLAEMRLGGHISAVSFGPLQMGVSAGWAHQQNLGSGYYGSMNFYLTY
jgi:hypothetical protein